MMTLTECWSQSSFSVLLLAQDEFSCLKHEKERKRKQEKKNGSSNRSAVQKPSSEGLDFFGYSVPARPGCLSYHLEFSLNK